ncbi:cell division cycle protein 16-like isoform X1 [Dinothrombium tinctorium]|uniref:Cell division cycle protein 16-like isoform X1 n=1 Tax=Dinothrombium tinctorium TaxID=1965070 RepID=A0A3S3QWS5_9ACAR|nr:cell division cycle protein 16-like isoform X1 [Dinothrombium tinctorium]
MDANCFESDLLFKLRQVVNKFVEVEDYKSAAFWSNKVISLSNECKDDVYILAKCFFHLKEYHRASHCIKSRNLHKYDLSCRHLSAKCHFVAQEYNEAFEILECSESGNTNNKEMEVDPKLDEDERKWRSAIALLKGQIYEAMDNRGAAVTCFKEALKWNIHCYEAFHSLVQHQMLTIQEEEELISSLNFDAHCSSEEAKFTKFLYQSQLKKYAKPSDFVIPDDYLNSLQTNVDVQTAMAERCYYNCDYHQCYKFTSQYVFILNAFARNDDILKLRVLEKDIYHTECLPIHLSCLMELKKTNVLFDLAHKLVELYPESPISWYAVGCYYLMINKTDAARRFLNKATTLDSVFGPAWLLYGHSFAVEKEHDQAMAAYFKASHLMKGCHLPLLYIGLEYGLTDNTKLAEKFFNQALVIAPDDPFVLHELGVIAYQNQDYNTAEKHFNHALSLVKMKKDGTSLPEKWEPLLNNLGHVLRKLKKYEEALQFHREALVLSPQNPSTYSAIGYIYSLMCQWNTAVEYFHKALGLKREDPFSTAMLGHAIEHLINEITPIDDELPMYESPDYITKFLSKNNLEDSTLGDKLLHGTEVETEKSENERNNNTDIDMEISGE